MPVEVEKKGDLVKDWMNKDPVVIDFTKSIADAAILMLEKKIGSLLVREKDQKKLSLFRKKIKGAAGIVTDTDLIRKVMAQGLDPEKTIISSVMSSDVVSVSSTDTIIDASVILAKHRIKRLPVIEEGYNVGIITATDIMYALSYNNRVSETQDLIKSRGLSADSDESLGSEQSKVRTWMSTRLSLIGETENVKQVAMMMEARKIGAILVIGQMGDLAGIVTDTDLVRKVLATKLDPLRIPVSKVMTRDVISVSPDMEIPDLANVMTDNKIKRTAVISEDQLLGIISITDVMNALFKLSKTSNIEPMLSMLKNK